MSKTTRQCSWCGEPQDAVECLVAGPASVFMCNECLDLCNDMIGEDSDQEYCLSELRRRGLRIACSFCGKGEGEAGKVIAGPHPFHICVKCVGRLS